MIELFVISIIIIFNIIAIRKFHKRIDEFEKDVASLFQDILDDIENIEFEIEYQGKKTRKESQEIKTRLTQVRKDLNIIENSSLTKKKK